MLPVSPKASNRLSLSVSPKQRVVAFEEEIMQKTVRFSAVATIITAWLLTSGILIFAANFDIAQAQDTLKKNTAARTLACAKVFRDRCNDIPVGKFDLLACLNERVKKLPAGCVELAKNFVRMCDGDAHRLCKGVVEGKGNVIGCLTTSWRLVSPQCNAAIDAAHLRE
jgi:hypothetical protein